MKTPILPSSRWLVALLLPCTLTATDIPTGAVAAQAIGQPDFETSIPDLPASASSLKQASRAIYDPVSDKFFVADTSNNRVLRFPPGSGGGTITAEAVFGMPDFNSSGGGTSDNELNGPTGMAIDDSGNLWVCDTGNNRVLRFPGATTAGPVGPSADVVLGQTDFSSSSPGTSSGELSGPSSVAVDGGGNVWVADTNNHRVLRFPAGGSSGVINAEAVLGQPDLRSGQPGSGSTGFNEPAGLAFDSGGSLWVSDRKNHRILRFSSPGQTPPGTAADLVLGKPDFNGTEPGGGQTGVHGPSAIQFDSSGNLWVADTGNNRVLRYSSSALQSSGPPADAVLGMPDFVRTSPPTSPSGHELLAPTGIAPKSGELWVADQGHSRVLRFSSGGGSEGNIQDRNCFFLRSGSTFFIDTLSETNDVQETLTIRNDGLAALVIGSVTVSGTDAASFSLDLSQLANALAPGEETTLTLTFHPGGPARTAMLEIAMNDPSNPVYGLELQGTVVDNQTDSDADGLNDAAELSLASLGFCPRTAQPDLVNTLQAEASLAGLFSTTQIQAMNVGTPLLTRDPNGEFTLEIGVEKSSDLTQFTPFPMTPQQIHINPEGMLEFRFTTNDDAAFFLLNADEGSP